MSVSEGRVSVSHAQPMFPRRGLRTVLIWPFVLVGRTAWYAATALTNAIGIVLALVLGFALTGLGVMLCMSFVALPIGLPLTFVGMILLIRALY